MRLVQGNLGRAPFKISAVDPERWTIEAPARCFADQDEVLEAFQAGELDRDVVVVVRFQGPRANGMPELHKLTPALGVVQDRGFKVALVTDGRMSGASGKVPAASTARPRRCRRSAVPHSRRRYRSARRAPGRTRGRRRGSGKQASRQLAAPAGRHRPRTVRSDAFSCDRRRSRRVRDAGCYDLRANVTAA